MAEIKIPNEIENLKNSYEAMFKDRTEAYVKKCIELRKEGPGPEFAQPIGPVFPPYPWWNIFLIGPIQITPGGPIFGPFLPSKVIDPNNPAWFIVGLWRNPGPIDWVAGNVAACVVMNPLNYQINFELVNLTTVTDGPDLPPINGNFANAPICFEFFIIPMIGLPAPQEGKPDLYNLYATVDIVGQAMPMAGAASWIFDPDTEPGWMFFPPQWPQWRHGRPVEFLVYFR
jgi:hypothetical protein